MQTERKRKVVTMMRHSITFRAESGQTMAEYALVVGVITFVIVTTFALLSDTIVAAYQRTFDILTSVV
jgi:Flp pilus assembly pilin Flp